VSDFTKESLTYFLYAPESVVRSVALTLATDAISASPLKDKHLALMSDDIDQTAVLVRPTVPAEGSTPLVLTTWLPAPAPNVSLAEIVAFRREKQKPLRKLRTGLKRVADELGELSDPREMNDRIREFDAELSQHLEKVGDARFLRDTVRRRVVMTSAATGAVALELNQQVDHMLSLGSVTATIFSASLSLGEAVWRFGVPRLGDYAYLYKATSDGILDPNQWA